MNFDDLSFTTDGKIKRLIFPGRIISKILSSIKGWVYNDK